MAKHILPVDRITGEFKYLYASASGINQKPKRLYFTVNITEEEENITYDVELEGEIYPFIEQQNAIEYYNKF